MIATRMRALPAAALALALTVVLLPVAPRPVAPALAAAGRSSVDLEGRGYGHGKGLSQWGVQAAAEAFGRTYRQILRFYYPRLELGRAGGLIRVKISADTTEDVVVRNTQDLLVRRVANGSVWDIGGGRATRWRLTPADGGQSTRLWKRTDRWRPVRTIAGEAEFRGDVGSVALVTPDGVVPYQGSLRSTISADGRDTVNVLLLEEYLRGVVPLEVPALWHPQAVRAQAVAARTYAAFERAANAARHFDVYDTTQSQVYGGISARHPASDQAIRATRREVLLHEGAPAFTQFSASNGGWTVRHPEHPYLRAKEDPWDRWKGNPYRRWTVTLRAAAIERAYPKIGDFRRLRVLERDGNGAWNGRVVRIRIVGSTGAIAISGDTFRSVFGLRSTWFRQV